MTINDATKSSVKSTKNSIFELKNFNDLDLIDPRSVRKKIKCPPGPGGMILNSKKTVPKPAFFRIFGVFPIESRISRSLLGSVVVLPTSQ